ncbi:Rossmann fold domain-containing protein [Qipengyuania sp. JC766]|uniref:Rossmann fold domain-containing protein n=1 Tax=Qipengyuania sp. JC766 TaxID=3232139 RepID=UPI0034599B39
MSGCVVHHANAGGEDPVQAAARFLADELPAVIAKLLGGADVLVAFPVAGWEHTDWRRTLARDLARGHAPERRVNVTATDDAQALAALVAFLDRTPGVTGQYLPLHDQPTKANRTGAA